MFLNFSESLYEMGNDNNVCVRDRFIVQPKRDMCKALNTAPGTQ